MRRAVGQMIIFSVVSCFFLAQQLTVVLRYESGIFRLDTYLNWIVAGFALLISCGQTSKVLCKKFIPIFFVISTLALFGWWRYMDDNCIYFFVNCICFFVVLLAVAGITTKWKRYLIGLLFIALIVQLAISFAQFSNYPALGMHIKGSLYNSGFLANFILGIVPYCLAYLCFPNHSRIKKIVVSTIFILAVIVMVFTTARAALIGLIVAGVTTLIFYRRRKLNSRLYLIAGLSFAVLILLPFLLLSHKTASLMGRLNIYRICIDMLMDKPLFGIGVGRFSAEYNNYQAAYFARNNLSSNFSILAEDTFEAFNLPLELLCSVGLIGAIAIVVAIFPLLKRIKDQLRQIGNNWYGIGAASSLMGLFASSLFSNPFHLSVNFLVTAVGFGIVLSENKRKDSNALGDGSFQGKRNYLHRRLLGGALISLVALFIRAECLWSKGYGLATKGRLSEAQVYYNDAARVLKYHGNFWYNYGAEAMTAERADLALVLLKEAKKNSSHSNLYLFLGDAFMANGNYAEAEANYSLAMNMVPSRFESKYLLLKAIIAQNKVENALQLGEEILSYPVKVSSSEVTEYRSQVKYLLDSLGNK